VGSALRKRDITACRRRILEETSQSGFKFGWHHESYRSGNDMAFFIFIFRKERQKMAKENYTKIQLGEEEIPGTGIISSRI
jgi:hypothetical protein